MIEFPCPQCGQPVHAQPQWAGKKVGCRQCGAVCVVPHASIATDQNPDEWVDTLREIDRRAQGKTARLDDLNDVVEIETLDHEPAQRVARRAPLLIALIIIPITIALVGLFTLSKLSPPQPKAAPPPPPPTQLAPIQPLVVESDRRRMVSQQLFQAIEQGQIAPLIEALATEPWLLQTSIEWTPPANFDALTNDPTARGPQDGWTLVHHAVWYQRPTMIRALADANAPNDAQTSSGFTPLHIAVLRHHSSSIDVIHALLRHPRNPAKIDLSDQLGRTALMLAVQRADLPMVKLLDSLGADPTIMDATQNSPINDAINSRDQALQQWGRTQALRDLGTRSLTLLNVHAPAGLTTITANPFSSNANSRTVDPFISALERSKRQASLAQPSPDEIKTLYWQRAQFAQALAAAARQQRESRALEKQLDVIEQTIADGQFHRASLLYNELADKRRYLLGTTFDRYLALEPTFRAIERQWLESAISTLVSGDIHGALVELCAAQKAFAPLPKIDTAEKMLTLWKGDLYYGRDLGDITFEILDAQTVADLRLALIENDTERTNALLPNIINRFGSPEKASRIRALLDRLDDSHQAILGLHDLDWQNERGRTLLHEAIDIADAALVRLLLAIGINIDALDDHRMTALHWAVIRKNLELTNVLLSHGADPNIADDQKRKPIDWAILLEQPLITQRLRTTP